MSVKTIKVMPGSSVTSSSDSENGYDITVERGGLSNACKYFRLDRKVCIVTDSGVPEIYVKTLAGQCKEPFIVTLSQGEANKNTDSYLKIVKTMLDNNFTRSDAVAAVGGGIPGDIAGFASATFMRGTDFYNVPTTMLSQVDSSIGGKTAVNLDGYKNILGAFHQPKAVLIDPLTLSTLPRRQLSNGLCEAVKMAATLDKDLFESFENENIDDNIDNIIIRSLEIKADIVHKDEREAGLRKVLNFGHTIGHAIESLFGNSIKQQNIPQLYHGECVSLGMIPMAGEKLRGRLISVLQKLGLPTDILLFSEYGEQICHAVMHDKKSAGDKISVVFADALGEFTLKNITFDDLKSIIFGALNKN